MAVVSIDRRASRTPEPTEQSAPSSEADGLFVWDREPPSAWVDTLNRLAPPSDHQAHYRLVWEPGEPQAPVQRWMVWQMRPKVLTEKMLWMVRHDLPGHNPKYVGLLEEHPRHGAVWDANMGCYRKRDGRLAKTDRLTWELYRRTGCYGERFWVVQGDKGGHRWGLTETEKRLLWIATKGQMKDVPLPGDLAYAPFDQRVVRHLLDIERVLMVRRVLKYADQHEAQLDAEEREEAEQARALWFDWIGQQFDEVADEFRSTFRQVVQNRPVGMTKEYRMEEAAQREHFVRTGTMLS